MTTSPFHVAVAAVLWAVAFPVCSLPAEEAPPAKPTEKQLEARRLVQNFHGRHFYDLGDPDAKSDLAKLKAMPREAAQAAGSWLAETLHHPKPADNWITVYKPLYLLKEIGPESRAALPDVLLALKHGHGVVVGAAVGVVGEIGPPAAEALPQLEELLKGPRVKLRYHRLLLEAIGKLDPKRAEQLAAEFPPPAK